MSNTDCVFCQIVTGKIKADIVSQSEGFVAFKDINPQAPTHIVVIPNAHLASLTDLRDQHFDLMGKLIMFLTKTAKDAGLAKDGFRTVINTGAKAGQTVFHIHAHLLGGRPMQWPPG